MTKFTLPDGTTFTATNKLAMHFDEGFPQQPYVCHIYEKTTPGSTKVELVEGQPQYANALPPCTRALFSIALEATHALTLTLPHDANLQKYSSPKSLQP